jgi:hypothetical protein
MISSPFDDKEDFSVIMSFNQGYIDTKQCTSNFHGYGVGSTPDQP